MTIINKTEQNVKPALHLELFPQLVGLKGGKKQEWINTHLDIIASMSEIISFDKLCELLHCKADTLASALRRAEKHHRPSITQADHAMSQARQASNKADMALGELSVQSSALASLDAEMDDLKGNLTRYFDMMAQVNTIMSKTMVRQSRYRSFHNIYLVRTASKSVQLSKSKAKSSAIPGRGAARLLVSTRGSSQLPRQEVKGVSRRHYSRTTRGWPYV